MRHTLDHEIDSVVELAVNFPTVARKANGDVDWHSLHPSASQRRW